MKSVWSVFREMLPSVSVNDHLLSSIIAASPSENGPILSAVTTFCDWIDVVNKEKIKKTGIKNLGVIKTP
jgi:hypothetical protein